MDTRGRTAQRRTEAVSRRGFLTLAAGGVGGLVMGGAAVPAWAAALSPTPKLPGEYFRRDNQVTAAGTQFDNICVRINGDAARMFVPRTVKPNSGVPVPVVWFYHGAQSDHNALENGFKNHSYPVVDRGAIAICQTAGGTLFSHPTAVSLQAAGYAYMANLFTISSNVLRATSAGGALAIETYATNIMERVAGLYNVNGTYDLRAQFDDSTGSTHDLIVAAFGDDPAALDAANPARHPASAWAAKRLRVCVSQPNETDTVVPPDEHGLKLVGLAGPVAAEASVQAHTSGHSTPGVALPDFLRSMDRWGVFDRTAPSVSIVSPANGATVSGTVTVVVKAADNVAVVDVALYVGTRRVATAARGSDNQWRVSFNTKSSASPNGAYNVTARATDSAGNATTSAPIKLTIKN